MSRALADKNLHTMIIRYVDSPELRHLTVPVVDIDQIQRLLNEFRNLYSIQFLLWAKAISSVEITACVKTLMPRCLISRDSSSVSIWLDQRMKTTNS